MKCPDCKGSGESDLTVTLPNIVECEPCGGTGEVPDVQGTAVAAPKEQDGVIRLGSFTSDGTTGPQWIKRLEKKGFYVTGSAKNMLRSPYFIPTNGDTTEIVILKGNLFVVKDRKNEKIRAEARCRGLATPNAEIACLIRERFPNKEIETMGLSLIVTMHEPIEASGGVPCLLGVCRTDYRDCWLDAYLGRPYHGWSHNSGFAFVV